MFIQSAVVLDGKEIGTTIGYKHNGDYFHYINGHSLEVRVQVRVQVLDLH